MHAGPVPHWQSPDDEQVSAVVTSHGVHAPPTGPHAIGDCATQALAEQHPVVQDVASHVHAPPKHS